MGRFEERERNHQSNLDSSLPEPFWRSLYKILKEKLLLASPGPPDFAMQKYSGKEVHGIYQEAKKVLYQLEDIRNVLQQDQSKEIRSFTVSVVDPMLQDLNRIKKIMKKHTDNPLSDQTLSKYEGWLSEARLWIELYDDAKVKGEVFEVVAHHLVDKTLHQIERDILMINDYKEHRLTSLMFVEGLKSTVEDQIQEEMHPYVEALNSLMVVPDTLSIKAIGEWRKGVDEERQHLINAALLSIDNTIELYVPANFADHEDERFYVEMLEKIISIEDELDRMEAEGGKNGEILSLFEGVAQELHSDLRVPNELVERLEGLLARIKGLA